ncbi:hypothetical protein [Shewanella sp. SM21]|uniref:hypothetical protein n=1 Tax=Shewanella sp. SM21 TaxID=2912793 RepID=UPI0021DA1572|nr:hypothetical protein [Shewanella sp. SM21]MCU8086883.1 hypothetical protein [Shewanella sp. SM21]
MSTQETAALIESVNQMTATVAGKMGQIDQKVENAANEFKAFQNSSDARYMMRNGTKVFVQGDPEKFYPVFIPGAHIGLATLQIARTVHDDRQWSGAMTATFLFQNNAWGGYPSFLIMDAFGHSLYSDNTPSYSRTDGFIADYINGTNFISGAIFWLRGDHSYVITSSLLVLTDPVVHDQLVQDLVFDHRIHVFRSGFDITYGGNHQTAGILTQRNLTTVPTLSYVRGA